jgi:LmbE family N-acetylglucosaminyl deacetylase
MSNAPGQPGDLLGVSIDLPVPSVALAVGAHPDDVEFGCGGTLAKWATAGCVVHHLVLTDGAKGTWNADADVSALVVRRQREQRDAARALAGERAGDVRFLGWSDGELDAGLRQRSQVAAVIRELRPDVVLGHDPWKRYRLHPDHRAAGLLVCDAVVAARDPHFFREHHLPHHRPNALLLWEADEPNHVERLSEGDVQRKLSALHAHVSQFESTMGGTTPDELAAFDQRIADRLAEIGAAVTAAYAERFHAITDL